MHKYQSKNKEFFIAKYGEKEGIERFLKGNKLKGFTLENYIKKYGKKEGIKKFNEISQKRKLKYSEISQEL